MNAISYQLAPQINKYVFDNIFNSQYDNYLLFLENTSSSNPEFPAISIGFRSNGITLNDYSEYITSKITYGSSTKFTSGFDNCFRNIIANHGNGFNIEDKIEVYLPSKNSAYATVRCESIFDDSYGINSFSITNGIHKKKISCDGIELTWDSSNFIRSGKLTIYGYSK